MLKKYESEKVTKQKAQADIYNEVYCAKSNLRNKTFQKTMILHVQKNISLDGMFVQRNNMQPEYIQV
jgi:hypothetical protein